MDIEELINTHASVRDWLGWGISHVAYHAIGSEDFLALTKFLQQGAVLAPRSTVEQPLIRELVPDPLGAQNIKHAATILSLAAFGEVSLADLHAFPATTKDALEKAKFSAKKHDHTTYVPLLIDQIQMPLEPDKRTAFLLETFGALYDRLHEVSQAQRDIVSREEYAALVERLDGITGLAPRDASRFAWALATDGDPLKGALAFPAIADGFRPGRDYAERVIRAHLGAIKEAGRQGRDASRKLSEFSHQNRLLEGALSRRQKDLDAMNAHAQSLEHQMAALQGRLGTHGTPEASSPEIDALKKQFQQAQDDATTYLAMVHETERERDDFKRLLDDERRRAHQLEQKLAGLERKADSQGGISNGTGIAVYASPDFRERYAKVLFAYVDDTTGDAAFPDIIDALLKYLCHRIRDGGKDIILKEFEYMPQVKTHFFKKTDKPAQGTRVFFTTDLDTRLTVYDVVTPAEHDEKLGSDRGRYKSIMDNRVAFTFDERKHVRIERTVRELLSG